MPAMRMITLTRPWYTHRGTRGAPAALSRPRRAGEEGERVQRPAAGRGRRSGRDTTCRWRARPRRARPPAPPGSEHALGHGDAQLVVLGLVAEDARTCRSSRRPGRAARGRGPRAARAPSRPAKPRAFSWQCACSRAEPPGRKRRRPCLRKVGHEAERRPRGAGDRARRGSPGSSRRQSSCTIERQLGSMNRSCSPRAARSASAARAARPRAARLADLAGGQRRAAAAPGVHQGERHAGRAQQRGESLAHLAAPGTARSSPRTAPRRRAARRPAARRRAGRSRSPGAAGGQAPRQRRPRQRRERPQARHPEAAGHGARGAGAGGRVDERRERRGQGRHTAEVAHGARQRRHALPGAHLAPATPP